MPRTVNGTGHLHQLLADVEERLGHRFVEEGGAHDGLVDDVRLPVWSNILDRFARRIRHPRYTDGRILALLADTMGIVSRRMNWSSGVTDSTDFAGKFVDAVTRRRGGRKSGFLRPPNFNPTANAADRTYKKHLKLLNTMVELFVEGPRSGLDFTALKKRVNHFKESARLQRTGRESASEDDE